MSRIDEIMEGWKNYFFRKPEIEKLARERLAVCVSCEYYNFLNICTLCTCPGAGKARSPESRCLANKWEDGKNAILQNNISSIDISTHRAFLDEQNNNKVMTYEEVILELNGRDDPKTGFATQEEWNRVFYLKHLIE